MTTDRDGRAPVLSRTPTRDHPQRVPSPSSLGDAMMRILRHSDRLVQLNWYGMVNAWLVRALSRSLVSGPARVTGGRLTGYGKS